MSRLLLTIFALAIVGHASLLQSEITFAAPTTTPAVTMIEAPGTFEEGVDFVVGIAKQIPKQALHLLNTIAIPVWEKMFSWTEDLVRKFIAGSVKLIWKWIAVIAEGIFEEVKSWIIDKGKEEAEVLKEKVASEISSQEPQGILDRFMGLFDFGEKKTYPSTTP